jgi:hypothetical protein
MKKLNIAMLSDQTGLPSSPEETPITGGVVEDPDTGADLDDLHVAMTDLEHIDEVIGQAIQTSSELMDEGSAAQQVQSQQEGISQPALESLQRNVNSLLRQVGIEQCATFALGSYSNSRHNKVALESAIDNIKAAIKQIWDAAMAAISKTMDIVKAILKKYFDASLKIKKSCQAIKSRAISLKGKTHRSTERVGGYHIARYMRYNNRLIEPGAMVANYDKWMAHNYDFIASIAGKSALGEYDAILKRLADYFSSLGIGTTVNDVKRETDAVGDLMIKRIVSNFDYHRNGVHTTRPFIGDSYYKFDESNLSFSIESIDDFKEFKVEETHIPFDTDQVVIMCDKIIQHMKHYEQINTYFDELNRLRNTSNKIAAEALSGKGDLDFVQKKAISAGASFTIRIFIDAIRKVGIGARQYDIQVTTAIVQWCGISMNTL